MNDEKQITEDSLAAALRDEAAADSPEFSQELHGRIMGDISRVKLPAVGHPRAPVSLRWSLAVAAILAVIVTLRIWPIVGTTRRPVPVASVGVPELAPIATLANPGAERLDQARYAYLDKDAAQLTHYMMEQVDVFPSHR